MQVIYYWVYVSCSSLYIFKKIQVLPYTNWIIQRTCMLSCLDECAATKNRYYLRRIVDFLYIPACHM